ncbi:MAG: preprotein translocase subunit SecE [Flavobacteriales bacterium]|nr:preprotein translocase subunit SecE [Flavobacteriales bacterium]
MANVIEYVKDSYTELVERVTWPGPKQLQEASVLVFVASLVIAGIVFAMDWAFGVNNADSLWQGVIGMIYTYVI